MDEQNDRLVDIRKAFPNLSDDELEEAYENLRQYLLIAWEIWEAHPERFRDNVNEGNQEGKT